jgi:hypothetical protein
LVGIQNSEQPEQANGWLMVEGISAFVVIVQGRQHLSLSDIGAARILDGQVGGQSLDLVEDLPFQVFRRLFGDGRVMFVEIFTWKDDGAERAHDHLEIRELWQQMSECVAPHEGQPAMAFPHFSNCGCTP